MDRAVTALIAKIRDETKNPEAILLGSEMVSMVVPRMRSGSLALDVALGGGWPANQWNEIIGNESHGKTSVVLKAVAFNQQQDPNWTCVWVAAEPYDAKWAAQLGVDNDRMVIIEENGMETALNQVIRFAETKAVDCIVIDSWPMLVPEREQESKGGMEDFQPGLHAFLSGKFFKLQRKATRRSLVNDERPITGLIINQWREKIGVMHGDPRTTPGGKGKNFAFYTRIEVKRDEWIATGTGDNKAFYGQVLKVVNVKNKSFPPKRIALIDFYFDDYSDDGGVSFKAGDYDMTKDTLNTSLIVGSIVRRGNMYDFMDQSWKGRAGVLDALRKDPELVEKVHSATLSKLSAEMNQQPEKKTVTRKKK